MEAKQANYTLAEFCEVYRISRGHFYILKAAGKAPQELRLGKRVIITRKAAQAWEERMIAEQNAATA